MRHEIPRLEVTWPERYLYERIEGRLKEVPDGIKLIKRWSDLEEEAHEQQALIAMGFQQFPPKVLLDSPMGKWMGACPGPFSVDYAQCFFALPSVMEYIVRQCKHFEEQMEALKKWEKKTGQRVWKASTYQDTYSMALTEVYTGYSVRRWQHYGKRIYVIDPDTFTLLSNTELPRMPLDQLRGPHPTFWLQFPANTYQFQSDIFTLESQGLPNVQSVDGVMVSFSHTEPDHPHRRQITLVVGGRSLRSPSDDNVVYFNETLDDRSLADLWRDADDTGLLSGGYEIGILTPRVILNFCLYLMSEQPRLEPIPPIERRKFSEIRSPQQRMAALASQEAKLAKKTRLGYIYVGRLPQPLGIPHEEGSRRKWTLNKKVWVQGHWKFQPYGPKHALRKLIHVPPYFKGKMFGEGDVSAARVQPAREVTEVE